jgi:hypothetical protein
LEAPFYRGWLEYRADGLPWDGRQKDAILHRIDTLKSSHQYVLVYVHGWHHNADSSPVGAGWERKNAVKFDDLLARHADQVRRYHALRLNAPPPEVIGIYVGWQGERTRAPLASLFSIGDRARVADEIGRRGELARDLTEIAEQLRRRNGANRMMVIGHSLGGRMLTEALLGRFESNTGFPLGAGALIVTINAAVSANKYRAVLNGPGRPAIAGEPTWINITSTDDGSTRLIYPVAAIVRLLDSTRASDTQGSLTWKTVGHYQPFITHHLEFKHHGAAIKRTNGGQSENCKIPWTREVARQCGLPDEFPIDGLMSGLTGWTSKSSGSFGLAYPRHRGEADCEREPPRRCYDFRDADFYSMSLEVKQPNLAPGRLWNISTTKDSINYEKPRLFDFATHNGYVSTNLTRILVEAAFSPRPKTP